MVQRKEIVRPESYARMMECAIQVFTLALVTMEMLVTEQHKDLVLKDYATPMANVKVSTCVKVVNIYLLSF